MMNEIKEIKLKIIKLAEIDDYSDSFHGRPAVMVKYWNKEFENFSGSEIPENWKLYIKNHWYK